MDIKTILGTLGGLVGTLVLLHYALRVARDKTKAGGVASWLMWTMIDTLLLVTTWQAGKPIWLPLGWTIGAGTVTLVLLRKGAWKWSHKESLSAVCAALAMLVWWTQGAVAGVVAGTLALTFAGLPFLIDMITAPIPEMFYIFFFTLVACTLTLLGSDGSWAGMFTASGSLTYNITMCYLLRRKEVCIKG